jgi:hypothetical protein
MASILITEMAVVIWASDVAVVVVLGVVLAGVAAVIGGDVAFARAGSGCERRDWGSSWGWQGGVRGVLDQRWGWWGWQSGSVKYTTCFDEHVCSSLRNSIVWAVDCLNTSFTASLTASRVPVSVWVLDVTQIVVLGVSAAGVAAIVGCDIAMAVGGSECEMRGLGVRWSALGRPGRECCRLRGAGDSFEAGEKLVVAVVDNVDNVDGGCVAIVRGDVEAGEVGVDG